MPTVHMGGRAIQVTDKTLLPMYTAVTDGDRAGAYESLSKGGRADTGMRFIR